MSTRRTITHGGNEDMVLTVVKSAPEAYSNLIGATTEERTNGIGYYDRGQIEGLSPGMTHERVDRLLHTDARRAANTDRRKAYIKLVQREVSINSYLPVSNPGRDFIACRVCGGWHHWQWTHAQERGI